MCLEGGAGVEGVVTSLQRLEHLVKAIANVGGADHGSVRIVAAEDLEPQKLGPSPDLGPGIVRWHSRCAA